MARVPGRYRRGFPLGTGSPALRQLGAIDCVRCALKAFLCPGRPLAPPRLKPPRLLRQRPFG